MVNVLIEANVFVVGGQAVDIVMGDEDEAVYEGAPASHMVNLFIVLFVDDFHVLFSVSEKSDVRASFQFENLVCLELHFVEAGCRQKLAFFLVCSLLFAIDQIVGEILEPDLLKATLRMGYLLRSIRRKSSTNVRISLVQRCQFVCWKSTSIIMTMNWFIVTDPLQRSNPFFILLRISGSSSLSISCLRLGSRRGGASFSSRPISVSIMPVRVFPFFMFKSTILIQVMSFLKKLFSSSGTPKEKNNAILIYLDADLKKSIEAKDQSVKEYEMVSNFEEDQFLYLMVLSKKTAEVILKRKLNKFERFSQCLQPPSEEFRCYIIVGYGSERSTIPKISSNLPMVENMKFIRSGVLNKFNEFKNSFEECQLKLHHDYLTFYKFKETEKKVSFMPLENSIVEMTNEKKCMFSVRDKFNSTLFKTSSKQDMYSWLIAINEAIKIRNSQIYMNEMEDKLHKETRTKLNQYITKCTNLKDQSRVIPLDDIGRKALKTYFKKSKVPEQDSKLLSIIEAYLYMCKCRREKGEAYSESIIEQIRESIREMEGEMPAQIQSRDLSSKNEFVKTIQEIMKYLDGKYRKQIIDKRNVHAVFQNYLIEQYKEERKIPLKTLFLNDPSF